MTSPNLGSVAADSNVLLSAISGKAALRVFATPELMVVTTDENVAEVLEYVLEFAARYRLPEETLLDALALLPIMVYSKRDYSTHIFEARALMADRDPDDIPLAALALKLGVPVWSNDRHFEDFPNGVFTTARLLKVLGV
ncbi:MAG TPA: PIN domain-containing protein [Thermoanaerobaculia bacterium]|nr:PIN domain-containing protein [Thermoanaerobaculia bacterium]